MRRRFSRCRFSRPPKGGLPRCDFDEHQRRPVARDDVQSPPHAGAPGNDAYRAAPTHGTRDLHGFSQHLSARDMVAQAQQHARRRRQLLTSCLHHEQYRLRRRSREQDFWSAGSASPAFNDVRFDLRQHLVEDLDRRVRLVPRQDQRGREANRILPGAEHQQPARERAGDDGVALIGGAFDCNSASAARIGSGRPSLT